MTNYMPENIEFYPTDHCGVLRCKTSEINPRYMAHLLDVEGAKMGFSRAYRASIDRVQGITFSVPERSVQVHSDLVCRVHYCSRHGLPHHTGIRSIEVSQEKSKELRPIKQLLFPRISMKVKLLLVVKFFIIYLKNGKYLLQKN